MRSPRFVLLCALCSVAGWAQKPVIFPGGVVNAASYATAKTTLGQVGFGLARSSIVSIFGTHLAASVESARFTPLPTQLGGAAVIVNGVPASLFYASPGQI